MKATKAAVCECGKIEQYAKTRRRRLATLGACSECGGTHRQRLVVPVRRRARAQAVKELPIPTRKREGTKARRPRGPLFRPVLLMPGLAYRAMGKILASIFPPTH